MRGLIKILLREALEERGKPKVMIIGEKLGIPYGMMVAGLKMHKKLGLWAAKAAIDNGVKGGGDGLNVTPDMVRKLNTHRGFDPESNFQLTDLSPEEIKQVVSANPYLKRNLPKK